MKKVLIPTKLNRVVKDTLEASGRYQVVLEEVKDLKAFVASHADAYAMIVRSEKITPEIIDMLPSLKVIVRAGSGYDNIHTKHARKKGIDVMTTPGANANAVAEEVIALILADARHLIPADPSTRAGKWEKNLFMGRELAGKTVGIVGLGAIGQLVARRMSGFDVTLLGFDPVISQERARSVDVELVDLNTLFEKCDYITLHIPENRQTVGLVNAALLSRMKDGATVINCARSGIIHEDDFRAVKATKKLRLLNDVYPKDAEGPKSITDIADIMLPHLGASTKEANFKAALHAAEELIEFDEKGISSYIVNRDIPAGLDEAFGELAYLLARLCRHLVGRDASMKLIESSFYGTLKPFANWLTIPVVSALSEDFDRSSDYLAAVQFLKDRGIDYESRETDDRKGYENSITLDFTASAPGGALRTASVRGTVTEGVLMISRINNFQGLYFEPRGHTVVLAYDDRPGVLGQIGAALAAAGINIDDVRNPHDTTGAKSIAILKVNQPVPANVLDGIAAEIRADTWFSIDFQSGSHRG